MKIDIIGIGTGNENLISKESLELIQAADLVIGAKRIIDSVCPCEKNKVYEINDEKIEEVIRKNLDLKIAVLMSGDTGFYSGATKLAKRIIDLDVSIHSGNSSLQYLSSKIFRPWQDVKLVSAHGKECNVLGNILSSKETFFLTGGKIKAENIIKIINKSGLKKVKAFIGERLSYENEKITSDFAENLQDVKFDPLSVVWVLRPEIYRDFTKQILDKDFIRAKVPMTKGEVRAVICDFFDVKEDDIIYDIGSGTGSIAISLAIKNPLSTVYAFEVNEEAFKLSSENIDKFCAYNVDNVFGEATEKIKDCKSPNHVFVGGSKGNLEKIIDEILRKNNEANILVSAVTMETLNQATMIFKEKFGENFEFMQISVSKSKKIGSYNMIMAENPIFLIGRRGKSGSTESNDISH